MTSGSIRVNNSFDSNMDGTSATERLGSVDEDIKKVAIKVLDENDRGEVEVTATSSQSIKANKATMWYMRVAKFVAFLGFLTLCIVTFGGTTNFLYDLFGNDSGKSGTEEEKKEQPAEKYSC